MAGPPLRQRPRRGTGWPRRSRTSGARSDAPAAFPSLLPFPSRRRLGDGDTAMCLSTRSAGWHTVWWQSPQPPPARSSAAEGIPSALTRFPNSLHLLLCPSKQPCSSGERPRHHHLTLRSVPPAFRSLCWRSKSGRGLY